MQNKVKFIFEALKPTHTKLLIQTTPYIVMIHKFLSLLRRNIIIIFFTCENVMECRLNIS